MISSIANNDFSDNGRMVPLATENESVTGVEKMVKASSDDGQVRSVNDHGDTYNMSDGGVKSRIELQADYVDDLATENFNTF